MALLELTIFPIGTGNPSIGDSVAAIEKELAKEGASFTLTDMGTIIEGEAKELLNLASKLHEVPFQQGAARVITQLRIDDRRDKEVHLGDKIASVEARLG